jgi:predicted Zn-dependent protease
MPKRDGAAIAHTSITNHRILARPGEPFPDEAFQMTTAALPDLIHLNAVPGEPLPKVTLLQAYEQLKSQSPAYAASYARVLADLEKSESSGDVNDPQSSAAQSSAIVQAALGHQALAGGQLQAAIDHLQASLRLNPAQASVYADLSTIADQQGRAAEAVTLQQSATTLEPFNAPLQKTLVLRLINAQKYEQAQAAMEAYLHNFPEDDFMRKMLAIAQQP